MVATVAIESLLYRMPRTEDGPGFALRVVDEYEERVAKLSEAQRDVLQMMCAGFRNKEMARESGVSLRTIEQRRKRIFNLFNVTNAAEMGVVVGVVQAFRLLLADELQEREGETADVLPLESMDWEGGAL